jgi:hypothetical protein
MRCGGRRNWREDVARHVREKKGNFWVRPHLFFLPAEPKLAAARPLAVARHAVLVHGPVAGVSSRRPIPAAAARLPGRPSWSVGRRPRCAPQLQIAG